MKKRSIFTSLILLGLGFGIVLIIPTDAGVESEPTLSDDGVPAEGTSETDPNGNFAAEVPANAFEVLETETNASSDFSLDESDGDKVLGELTGSDSAETVSEEQEDANVDGVEGEPSAMDEAEEEVSEDSEEPEIEALTFDVAVPQNGTPEAMRGEDDDTLTIDFADSEIRTILRTVADIFHLNLVIPETLTGRVSIKLHDVKWSQVFDVVLSPVGFTYIEEGNIIKVVSIESLTLEPPVTTVVILNYAQATDILATIEPLVSREFGGRVQVDTRSNALVITERPTQLRRIENIIDSLDKPNVQVMIESKFVETRNRALENIGVNWASLDGYGVKAGPFEHSYERSRVRGHENTRTGSSTMSQDQRSQSVTGSGTVTTTETSAGSGRSSSNLSYNDGETARLTTAVFSADEFGVILSALRTNNDVKLVSNPTVVTMNNRAAKIHIGEEFPIVLPRFNQQTGTYEAGEYSTVDVGIKLDVTPQVNNAGFINMEVEPDVSTLTGTIVYFGAEYPIRSTRNAKSFVTVRDGYTLAIGGLVQEDTLTEETRVPVLGSIPVLGRLFRSDGSDVDQRNLIIFLTARTLSPDGTTIEDQVDPRVIHSMGLKREEIPGYRPDIPMWPDEEPEVPAVEEEADEEEVVDPDQEVTSDFELDEVEEAETEKLEITSGVEETETEEPVAEGVEAVEDSPEVAEAAEEAVEVADEPIVESAEVIAETEVEPEVEVITGDVEAETEEPAPSAPRRRGGWLMP